MEPIDAAQRAHDLVVFGSTGDVRRLTVRHPDQVPPGLGVAIVGRSRQGLEAVRDELGAPAADRPLLVTEATDPAAMAHLASSIRRVRVRTVS